VPLSLHGTPASLPTQSGTSVRLRTLLTLDTPSLASFPGSGGGGGEGGEDVGRFLPGKLLNSLSPSIYLATRLVFSLACRICDREMAVLIPRCFCRRGRPPTRTRVSPTSRPSCSSRRSSHLSLTTWLVCSFRLFASPLSSSQSLASLASSCSFGCLL
jgi:hypothetical protein